MPPRLKMGGGGKLFLFCLSFCHSLWNFNLANNFWRVSARALIFHMNIPCDKNFPWVPLFFTLWPWPTLEFDPFFVNFNLANNFQTVSARALLFDMNIPCDKTIPWVPLVFTLWPWPWSLTHFLKTLSLLITFEQQVLWLWYFTWIFPVITTFHKYHYFLPCDLDLGVWTIFWNL